MESKECTSCFKVKQIDQFGKQARGLFGRRSKCKSCISEYNKKYSRKRWDEDAEYRERKVENATRWAKNNPEERSKIAQRRNKKIMESPVGLVASRCRRRLAHIFNKRRVPKTQKSEELIGCDWGTLKRHIESKFTEGMNWDNKSEWHIDHVIPLSSAKSIEDVIKLSHYTNLQPLWAIDNWKKGAKIFQATR